jgi:branched-chain amino acid transport system ATP-binding protein
MTPPPLLEVEDLGVQYGGVVALDGVSFDVGEGEVVGLIGPNGAGKTTCIDIVSGFLASDTGTVRFGGRDLTGVSPHDRSRRGFVRTFQSLELFDDLSVRENLMVAASSPTWWSTLTDALWPKNRYHAVADETLEMLDITELADRRPADLSNGERHLVALGRALASRPKLVLLDEPAAGLDTTESAALGQLLRQLPARGTAVLLIDHDMGLVLSICDRVHVLDYGRLVASGPPAAVRTDPVVIQAYLGTEASR